MKTRSIVILSSLLAVAIYMTFNFSKSNEEYVVDAQEAYNEILIPGLDKGKVKTYLKNNGASYNETQKENCRPWSSGNFKYECEYASSIHTRYSVGSFINPVRSGAHFYLFFDNSEKLVTYRILISHSFL